MTTLESNKQVVLKYVEAFNRGDLETLQAVFTPDALIQGVLGWGELDKVMPIWKELHEAFAIDLTVEEIIAEGDTVAVRYTERGTFAGSFRGQEPTGKPYELVAMEWFTLIEGKIHRRWGARDAASQARQIGMKLA
ncbi:MAG: ester cyclase [Cyanobacteriota bacterium]